jgi:DNA-binding MarR family transcriptional regulator
LVTKQSRRARRGDLVAGDPVARHPGAGDPVAGDAAGDRRAGDPAAGELADLLGYRLRLAQLAVFRDFAQSLGRLGVSPGRVGILMTIEKSPGLAQSRLAEAVGLDRSTIVPLLDQFETAGWVERRPGPDRRTNGVWLTAHGRRFVTRVKAGVRIHESRIAQRLTLAERIELMRLLDKVSDPRKT